METPTDEDRTTIEKLEKIKVINSRIRDIDNEMSDVALWTPLTIETLQLSDRKEIVINHRVFYKMIGVIREMLTEEKNGLIEHAKLLMK